MLAHAIGPIASAVVPNIGDVILASYPQPAYRTDDTGRYWGVYRGVERVATGGPFGGPYAQFNAGSGLFFDGDAGTDLNFGSSNFTIEGWVAGIVEPSGVVQIISNWSTNTTTRSWTVNYEPTANLLRFQCRTSGSSTVLTASFTVSNPTTFFDGTWHHFAAVRNGSTITLYIDGVAGGATINISTNSFRTQTSAFRPAIGAFCEAGDAGESFGGGRIAEVRITIGVARYTANFTPPSAEFPVGSPADGSWSSVRTLLKFDGTWGYNFVGTSGVDPGDLTYTSITGTNNFIGNITANGYDLQNCDSGAILSFPAPAAFNPGSGNFTVEIMFNYTSATSGISFFGFASSGQLCYFFRRMSPTTRFEAVVSTNGSSGSVLLEAPFAGTGDIHMALVRDGNELRWYVNGSLADTDTVTGAVADPTGDAFRILDRALVHGFIKGFRVVHGAALYSGASFTPPAAADLILPL